MKKVADDKAAKKLASKGKNSIMNGRALFQFNPDLFVDNDDEATNEILVKNENQEEEKVDESLFAGEVVDEDEEVDFD